jgi:hypothetical protein
MVLPEGFCTGCVAAGTQLFKVRDTPENAEGDSTTIKTRSATNRSDERRDNFKLRVQALACRNSAGKRPGKLKLEL